MSNTRPPFLTDAQLRAEIEHCEYCAEKPCREACPADCSPADFIMAVKAGRRSDFKRAAALILSSNPLGGICGAVCPDHHCVQACVRRTFDHPVNIPAVQATIIQKAKKLCVLPEFEPVSPNGKRIAVVGAGPSGLGAAAALARMGYGVDIFDENPRAGGMAHLIPEFRLPRDVLKSDIDFLLQAGSIRVRTGQQIREPKRMLQEGFHAIVVAGGLTEPLQVGFQGEDHALSWFEVLENPTQVLFKKARVVVIGGGAIAVDCAVTAQRRGASSVSLICLEKFHEMPLTAAERESLRQAGVEIVGRTRVTELVRRKDGIKGVRTRRVILPGKMKFHPRNVVDDPEAVDDFRACNLGIVAIGGRSALEQKRAKGIFHTGDLANGPGSVVEATAAGKNTALQVDAYLQGDAPPAIDKPTKSRSPLSKTRTLPVSLKTDFFGKPLHSPFLLSAGPTTDGYDQMRKAYQAGWPGAVMKTAFDGLPIHIPAEYMFRFSPSTYGNCDNVSGHALDRVCDEIGRLVQEFPDRLTLASTGGPVSGDDATDKKAWQSNTRKLEASGVMGIEYSLSCPQGGDGTKGDIVSQDAELTAQIIDWVLDTGDPQVPKLFKLTGAVTAIVPIVQAIQEVFDRYPDAKAGITLANSFPGLAFRPGSDHRWDPGIVVGLSGEGILPISNLTLAKVSHLGMAVSGNGGPMDYLGAAGFLALGAQTVQFCTIAMKYGFGIIDDLNAGLSYLLDDLGYATVGDFVGCLRSQPITGFEELTAVKKISAVTPDLCQHCGNCTRCPYLAITLDEELVPVTDPARCVGCSICALKCFSGALYMRDRTARERKALQES